jgi:uncharacterized protein YndB with AHSA1/START domain
MAAKKRPDDVARWLTVEHETTIDASPERTWRAIVEETSRWWREGFYALPNAVGMRMEPRIGGWMYEHADDGSSVVWATVVAVQPGRSIDLAGNLTAAFGGPAHVLLRLELAAKGKTTVVKVSESRVGRVADDAAAQTKKAWSLLLDGGLKPYAEKS